MWLTSKCKGPAGTKTIRTTVYYIMTSLLRSIALLNEYITKLLALAFPAFVGAKLLLAVLEGPLVLVNP